MAFLISFYFDKVLLNCLNWTQTKESPASVSYEAGIAGLHHHAKLTVEYLFLNE